MHCFIFFSHRLALVSSRSSENPAHYLEADDRMLSVMSGAPPSSMLVLCVHMPGQALLEIIDSIRQNVSCYYLTFALCAMKQFDQELFGNLLYS